MEMDEKINTVQAWIKDISSVLGVQLQLNAEGICTFQIGKDAIITIEIATDVPKVNIYGTLVNLPLEDSDAAFLMMSRALELNAFQELTRGGAIAMVPEGGLLIFCYTTPIEGIDSEIFSKILGNFYETSVELKEALGAISTNKVTENKESDLLLKKKHTHILKI